MCQAVKLTAGSNILSSGTYKVRDDEVAQLVYVRRSRTCAMVQGDDPTVLVGCVSLDVLRGATTKR